jgi:hypothetical protein
MAWRHVLRLASSTADMTGSSEAANLACWQNVSDNAPVIGYALPLRSWLHLYQSLSSNPPLGTWLED